MLPSETESDSFAEEIGMLVSSASTKMMPETALRTAERCYIDTLGVILAGSEDRTAQVATAAFGNGEHNESFTRATESSPTTAAFLNATAGHALDYDDVSSGMSGHPSVTMVPTALAVGEMVDASGTDLLMAYLVGFETQCRLAEPISPDHYERGWHATATLGTFGAAATAAHLLDLDTQQVARAINAAASFPAGLKRNFGTMTKPIHAGAAARSGVTAALLAAEGLTADKRAVDGESGFFELYGGASDWSPDREENLAIERFGIDVKKYPCCYFTHTPIATATDLKRENDIAPSEIEQVNVTVSRGASDALHHDNPTTGLEAKFSLPYTVASALVREQTGLAAFDDENVGDEHVQSVRERVTYETDDNFPYGSWRSTIEIQTSDHTVTHTRDAPPGTSDDPLSDGELRKKFEMCAGRVLSKSAVESLLRTLDGLRSATVEDVVGPASHAKN